GILFPVRDSRGGLRESEGSLPRESVSVGFLPYTQRTILVQAFKLLGAPYGWGGSGGEQDCSSFLQEIFSTVGIRLPRNSSEQAKAGSAVDLPSAVPAITILGMKGHIMLYLGEYEDNPYAIHAVWAYREPGPSGDIIRKIGRVAVTPLSLGEGSKKGSWQKRINSIKTLK
ncbi:MAG: C40 family peptidase, partial [Deltaproteobacteria bacterium]